MQNLKILWFSNRIIEKVDSRNTGTWLNTMSHGLMNTGEIALSNITQGKVKELVRRDEDSINQWIVPLTMKLNKEGLPVSRTIDYYLKVIDDVKPDLIHVWGTESYAGLITARKMALTPVLLEIQGIKGAIARIYDGRLTLREQYQCIGIKEVLMRSSIFHRNKQYRKWASFEQEMISNHKNITVLSPFMEAQVRAINPDANIFHSEIILRDIFYQGPRWQYTGKPVIFTLSANSAPFKGLHILIRAMTHLKKVYPDIELRIAGSHQFKGIRKDGYIDWILKEIVKV